jgi:hypothetical protein
MMPEICISSSFAATRGHDVLAIGGRWRDDGIVVAPSSDDDRSHPRRADAQDCAASHVQHLGDAVEFAASSAALAAVIAGNERMNVAADRNRGCQRLVP